jgi:hypothetical protein
MPPPRGKTTRTPLRKDHISKSSERGLNYEIHLQYFLQIEESKVEINPAIKAISKLLVYLHKL